MVCCYRMDTKHVRATDGVGHNQKFDKYTAMDLSRCGRYDVVRDVALARKQLRSDFVLATIDSTLDVMVNSRTADNEA